MNPEATPFLTRFFRAWADDIRIPVTAPPTPGDSCGRKTDPIKDLEKNKSERT